MAEVELAMFSAVFDVAFSGGCCSYSLKRSVEVIEHELTDRSLTFPEWFLPPPHIRYLGHIASTSAPSREGGLVYEDDSGRPTKRRRTGSPDRHSHPGEVRLTVHKSIRSGSQ